MDLKEIKKWFQLGLLLMTMEILFKFNKRTVYDLLATINARVPLVRVQKISKETFLTEMEGIDFRVE